jgi:hypothetical protein
MVKEEREKPFIPITRSFSLPADWIPRVGERGEAEKEMSAGGGAEKEQSPGDGKSEVKRGRPQSRTQGLPNFKDII